MREERNGELVCCLVIIVAKGIDSGRWWLGDNSLFSLLLQRCGTGKEREEWGGVKKRCNGNQLLPPLPTLLTGKKE